MMARRDRGLGVSLAVGAVLVALGVWMLMREPGTAAPSRETVVLTRDVSAGNAAPPVLPAAQARGARAESLPAPAPVTPPEVKTAASTPAAPALPGAEILFTGRVVDERGAPIAGAVVAHVPTRALRGLLGVGTGALDSRVDGDRLPQTTTTSDGRFAFTSRELVRDPDTAVDVDEQEVDIDVLDGRMPGLIVRHPDHATGVRACTDIRSGSWDAGDIVLLTGAVLTGRLLSAEGGVVHDAEVRLGNDGITGHLVHERSGPDGRFRVVGLAPGDAFLQVHHADFVPWRRRISIAAGSRVDLGDLTLDPARHIRGFVRDTQSRPLPGAALLARGSAQRMQQRFDGADALRREFGSRYSSPGLHEGRVTSDAAGAFDLGTLNQDSYDVFALAQGHEPACLRDVQAGTDDLVLELRKQASLLLTAVDADSRTALAGATAIAWQRSTAEGGFGEVQGLHLDVLAGAAAAAAVGLSGDGVGLVLVQGAGEAGTDVQLSAPGRATTGFVLPGVASGGHLARTLALPREAVLQGRVLSPGGDAIAGATVLLRWPAETDLDRRSTKSDADGRFRFGQLAPGDWSLSASARDFMQSLPVTVTVTDAPQQPEVELTLSRGAALTGQLLDDSGAPVAGHTLEIVLLDGPWKELRVQGQSGSDGRFHWPVLPAGSALVTAWPGAEARVMLVPGQSVDITLALHRKPVVQGRVLRAGEPVAQALVVAKWTPDSDLAHPQFIALRDEARQATASASGDYSLDFSSPGTLLLQARAGVEESRPVTVRVGWDRVAVVDLVIGD